MHAGRPSALLATAALLLQMAVRDCVTPHACSLLSSVLPPLSKLLEASCMNLRHALQQLPCGAPWPADAPQNASDFLYVLSQINESSGCSPTQEGEAAPMHAHAGLDDTYSNQSALMHAHGHWAQAEASAASGTFSEASSTAAVRRAGAAVRVLDACVSSVRDACMQCMQLRDKGECVDAFDLRVACITAGVRAAACCAGMADTAHSHVRPPRHTNCRYRHRTAVAKAPRL